MARWPWSKSKPQVFKLRKPVEQHLGCDVAKAQSVSHTIKLFEQGVGAESPPRPGQAEGPRLRRDRASRDPVPVLLPRGLGRGGGRRAPPASRHRAAW